MAIYFFDKNQTLIKIVPESATFEAIQTQELDDDSLLKDTLSVTVKGDEKLIDAEYMAVKSYKGNAQTFDMYRIVTDTTPDKSMSFTGMSLAPYELNGHIVQDLRPANHSLSYTLNRVLDGTDWRVGYIDDGLSNVTTTFYYVSAKEALKELQSLVGCEFVFKVEISGQKITDKWIEVYKEMGNRTKKRFNYGTNALTVVRETNKADIFTALIGRGKGEEVSSGEDNESGQAGYGRKITFEDIEWKKSSGKPLDKPKGQYYLELPQATQAYGIKNIDGTMKARVGIVDFDDEEDKNRLINLTYQQLLVSSRPKVLFKTTVANIGATGIGDTVTIHRHDLNIHYQTRVRKIVRNKLNDNKTQIELGDAVVTASTKQTKQNNATIKNLNNEIDKIKANVTTSQNSADGKNTIFYGSAEPERQRTGDTWYRPHPSIAGETQMLTWNGTAWELVIDTSDLTSVSRAVEDADKKADEAVQAAKDADDKANSALEKAGANANLLNTHQNTIDTINTVTLPDIASSAGTALANAKDAMDEAKKADGKIADYVTRNGLVSGTTVDTKINEATGEISKKITTVETDIKNLDNTNLFSYLNRNIVNEGDGVLEFRDETPYGFYLVGSDEDGDDIRMYDVLDGNGFYTISFDIKGTQNGIADLSLSVNKKDTSNNIRTSANNEYVHTSVTIEVTDFVGDGTDYISFNPNWAYVYLKNIKVQKGKYDTGFAPAPEDNYSRGEYLKFYENDYKRTAQGVTDTWTAVNKIVDKDGNTLDSFSKAVYDQNATRQTADFQLVTNDLVKTATYEDGIDGVKKSITSVQGKLDDLSGARNLLKESWHNSEDSPRIITSLYMAKSWELTEPLKLNKTYTFRVFGLVSRTGFDLYTSNSSVSLTGNLGGNTSDNVIKITDSYLTKNRRVWEKTFTVTQYKLDNMTSNKVNLYHKESSETGDAEVYWATLVEGTAGVDWSPSLTDQLGKAEFTIFKNDYEETAKSVERRLTAIDSDEDGSVVTRLNKTEKTASGNTTTISNIKTKPGEQITGYQTIKERSDLYERVIGKDENGVKGNISRIVQTSGIIQQEITSNNTGDNLVLNGNFNQGDTYWDGLYQVNDEDKRVAGHYASTKQRYVYGSYDIEVNAEETLYLSCTAWTSSSNMQLKLGLKFFDSKRQPLDWVEGVVFSPVHLPTKKNGTIAVPSNATYAKVWVNQAGDSNFRPWYFTNVYISRSANFGDTNSKITQMATNINLKVSKSDLISQINVQAGGVLITSGTNKLNVTPTTTYIENGTIKSAMIESLEAGKIKTGTLDAGKVKVINIDANNITANKTEFIQSNWNAVNAFTQIDASGIQMLGSGTWRRTFLSPTGFRMFNGQGAGNKAGAIGYFKSSTDLEGLANPLNEDFMWQNQQRHTVGIGVNSSHLLSLGFQNPGAKSQDGYNPAITIDPQKNGQVAVNTNARFNSSLQVDGDLTLPGGDYFTIHNGLYLYTSYWTVMAKTGVRFYVGDQKKLHIGGNVELGTTLDMVGNAITGQSDYRLKKNIETLNTNDLDKLTGVRMVSYEWIDPERPQGTHVGFIAQELKEVYPELITENDDGILSINNSELAMAHIHATQELNAKVDAHISSADDEVAKLKAQVASLQDELAQLKGA